MERRESWDAGNGLVDGAVSEGRRVRWHGARRCVCAAKLSSAVLAPRRCWRRGPTTAPSGDNSLHCQEANCTLARTMTVRITLIDDHQIVRDGVRLRLKHEPGFVVVGEAGSAAEGYASIRQAPPDLVLLDVILPGEDGISAIGKIRTICAAAKILLLSGRAEGTLVQAALQAGADGFMRKDHAGEILVSAVRVVLSGKIFLCVDSATALASALRDGVRAAAEPELTDRETALLKAVAEGLSYKEIAGQLDVSAKSVETYRTRLAKKLGMNSRAELVRYAVRKGLIAG